MAEPDKQELLKLALEELHRVYDTVSKSFDNLRTKALGLLAGEVAIVTFLFTTGSANNPFQHKSVPVYGAIFFSVGIVLLLYAFAMFLSVISSVLWVVPPEEQDIVKIHDRFESDPTKFLDHMRSEYVNAINHCVLAVNKKSKKFMQGIYSLSAGIFIIVVVIFGSSIIKI